MTTPFNGKYPKYDFLPTSLIDQIKEYRSQSTQTSIHEYPWSLYNFDINKTNRINWDKLPIKSQSSTSKSSMNRGLPLTINEEQRKRIIELLNKQKDRVAQSSTNIKSQRPAPEWLTKGFKSYEDYERHKKLLEISYVGGNKAPIPGRPAIAPRTDRQPQSWLFGWWWKQGQNKSAQDYPLLGKDPITWSPIKKSSQSRTGTRTGKTTTRKPMGFGTVLSILKGVVPIAWNLAKTGGDLLVNTFFQGQYGEQVSTDYILGQDEMPSASEVKGEEILVATRADLTKRQIMAAVADQAHIESSAFNMPTLGLKHSQVTVSLHLEYTFSPQPTEVNTTIGIPNVNFNDHVMMNLMPKNFAFYNKLLQHELIKFNSCTIVSSNTSGFDTTTNVGFFPATKNTLHVSNAVLLQMSKRLELDPEEKMAYTIRYVSPAIVKYEMNDQKQYTKLQSLDMFLEPNKIIRTEYLQGLAADEALSYGTVVIVKQNVGTVIGMSYTVNMVFDVWDYIINGCKLEDVEDKNLDGDTTDPGEPGNPDGGDDGQGGDGSGSGSSRPPSGSTRVGRRQVKK